MPQLDISTPRAIPVVLLDLVGTHNSMTKVRPPISKALRTRSIVEYYSSNWETTLGPFSSTRLKRPSVWSVAFPSSQSHHHTYIQFQELAQNFMFSKITNSYDLFYNSRTTRIFYSPNNGFSLSFSTARARHIIIRPVADKHAFSGQKVVWTKISTCPVISAMTRYTSWLQRTCFSELTHDSPLIYWGTWSHLYKN